MGGWGGRREKIVIIRRRMKAKTTTEHAAGPQSLGCPNTRSQGMGEGCYKVRKGRRRVLQDQKG